LKDKGSLNTTYGNCCKSKDLERDRAADAAKFIFDGCLDRKPPDDVIFILNEKDNPPLL
jgi:hypothetical protein